MAAETHLVLEPADDLSSDLLLRSLHDPSKGQVVFHPEPEARRVYQLGLGLLGALGKEQDDIRREKVVADRVAAWMAALEVRTLFVARAGLLTTSLLAWVHALAAAGGMELWLVSATAAPTRAQRELGDRTALRAWDWQDFEALWSDALAAPAEVEASAFPDVPDDDFVTFRAACQRLLDDDEFAEVDRAFRTAYREASERLDSSADPATGILALLREQTARCAGFDEVLVRLRATQAAAFAHRLLVKVNTRTLAGLARTEPLGMPDTSALRRLDRVADPRLACAALLARCADLLPAELAAIRLGEVSADGARIRLAGEDVTVPEPAMPAVRAQARVALMRGQTSNTALLASPGHQQAATETSAHDLKTGLREVEQETGVLLAGQRSPREREDDRSWARRRGVTVQAIDPPKKRR